MRTKVQTERPQHGEPGDFTPDAPRLRRDKQEEKLHLRHEVQPRITKPMGRYVQAVQEASPRKNLENYSDHDHRIIGKLCIARMAAWLCRTCTRAGVIGRWRGCSRFRNPLHFGV